MPIQTNEPVSIAFEVEVAQDTSYTQPYWTRASEYHDAVYTLERPEFRFLPFALPDVHGVVTYRVEGVDFTLTRPAQTVSINRPWGERRRLLTVAPAISLSVFAAYRCYSYIRICHDRWENDVCHHSGDAEQRKG